MSISTRAAGIAIAAAAVAGTTSPAHAAGAVYGGSTSAGAAIVINADKKARTLRSAVVSWTARCDDGRRFPMGMPLTAVKAASGFQPGFRELATSRNGKGRFAGTQLGGFDMGDRAAAMTATYTGKLSTKSARGTLEGTITIVDKASGNTVATCKTGSVRWSATRSPGRVFAGSTSQDNPIVLRLDAKRRKVANLLFGWDTTTCKPDDVFASVNEQFGNFPLSGGRFGDAFDQFYKPDGGGEGKVSYDITGRVASKRASGSLRVTFAETDPAGTTTVACDSETIPWSAVTG